MRVLITGITGFVGSHLAEFLLARKGIEVYGTLRWRSKTDNIDHLKDRIRMFECDMRDSSSIRQVITSVRPNRVFHLAAQSFVPMSWKAPGETLSTNVAGQINLLEAIRGSGIQTRVQIAGSSEEYGLVHKNELPLTEESPLRPLSPYAVSKVTQDLMGYQYARSYNMFIVRTRAFNHTGPRRGEVFATSTFAKQIALIEAGRQKPVLSVGNLDSSRDFTDVRDIVRAYWLALEKGKPGEVYNICSEKSVPIRTVLKILLSKSNRKITVKKDPARMRPSDVMMLRGDCSKFRRLTSWKPVIPFEKTMEDLLNYWREKVR